MFMKEVTLTEFKKHGMRTFRKYNTDRLRVTVYGGHFINMYLKEREIVKGEKAKEVKGIKECVLCGSLSRVRYIVCFDSAMAPGSYCYKCRTKHSLMDVKDAKRHNKIL